MPRPFLASVSLCALLAGSALAVAAETNPPAGSLYARLGGAPVVTKLVDATIDQVVASHRLNQSFKDTDLKRIKTMLVEQICQLAAGGCTYTGDPMREVHAGHNISEAEFYGMVEILRDNMRALDIGLRERNELLALLAPMKRDVVDVPAPPPPPPMTMPAETP
jgi:hemoglobin